MKIINNANKHNLPPRYALLNNTNGSLHVYASEKGLAIGIRYAVRTSRNLHALTVFKYTGCAWVAEENIDFLGNRSAVAEYEVPRFVDALHALCKLSCAYRYETETEAETETETETEAETETETETVNAPAYQRCVACAGSPASVRACVVFTSGGRTYVRGYQSVIRAWNGYRHYTARAFSSACILYRYSDGWAVGDSVFCRASPILYTEIRAFENSAIWHAVKHFGKGV